MVDVGVMGLQSLRQVMFLWTGTTVVLLKYVRIVACFREFKDGGVDLCLLGCACPEDYHGSHLVQVTLLRVILSSAADRVRVHPL